MRLPFRLRSVFRLVFSLVAASYAVFLLIAAPYYYCLARESAWLAARDEAELDRRMVTFYRKQVIRPEQSAWGRSYVLRPGECMVRYLVLYSMPLDVVFDRDTRMVAALTTYE